MKKRRITISLLSIALAFGMGLSSCAEKTPSGGDNGSSPIERTERISLAPTYNEETGEVSWQAAENATKYKVAVNLRFENEVYAEYETTALSQKLGLKQGISLVTVTAFNGDKEIGAGAITVSLDLDFGHPGEAGALSYSGETGILTWSAAEKAEKYKIGVTSYTNADFALEKQTAALSETLSLPAGVYEISVTAVNAAGSLGKTAKIEWASYTDAAFDTDEDGDYTYDLLKFNDVAALEIVRLGDEFKEWQTAPCLTGTAEIVDRATAPDFEAATDETTDGALKITAPANELENGGMCGATIRLPQQIYAGVISYDLYRDTGASAGVKITDETGHTAYYGMEDYEIAWQRWETVSLDISAFLKKNPDVQGVKEIGFYLRSSRTSRGGSHYIDNVSYCPMANIGAISYDSETGEISWENVFGAESYELYIGEKKAYEGAENSFIADLSSPAGAAEDFGVKLVAKRGGLSREKESVICLHGDEPSFGKATGRKTGEYYIAEFHNPAAWGQFTKNGYTGGKKGGVTFEYSDGVYDDYDNQTRITDGMLHVVGYRGWDHGSVKFALPKAIKTSESKITIRMKVTTEGKIPVFWFTSGETSEYLDSGAACVTKTDDGEWTAYTIDFEKWGKAPQSIDGIKISTNGDYISGSSFCVKEITCEATSARDNIGGIKDTWAD